MPWSGSEHLEVMPGTPRAAALVDGRYIVVPDAGRTTPSGTLPLTGTFAVFDTTTKTSRVFDGLAAAVGVHLSAVDSPGYAWVWVNNNLQRIDPVTGAVTTFNAGTAGNPPRLAVHSGIVWGFSGGATSSVPRGWNIASGATVTGTTSLNQARFAIPVGSSTWVARSSGAIEERNPTTGALIGSYTLAAAPSGATTDAPRAAAIGSVIYYAGAGGIVTFDTVTHATLGTFALSASIAVTTDGTYLYTYHSSSDTISAVDPTTGSIITDTAPTSRGQRFLVVPAAGKLWLPTGEPL